VGVLSLVVVVVVAVALAGGSAQATRAGAAGNGLIAFARADGIYVMRADGSGGVHALRRSGARGVVGMAWSPSGRKLAFTVCTVHPSGICANAIRVIEANGRHLVELVSTKNSQFVTLGVPTWSADGRRIAFSARRPGESGDIWEVSADRSNLQRLARTPDLGEVDVDWSPVGDRVVFEEIGGYFSKIHVMNTNGSEIRRLAPKSLVQGRTFQAAAPDWSPDGRRIAFMGWRGRRPDQDVGTAVALNAEIVVMGADGGSQVWLTNDDVRDSDPVWSPDGTRIAFARGGTDVIDTPAQAGSSGSEIYVMNADGTGVTRLTHNQVADVSPAWQPVVVP
jgi:TolB protein